MTSGCGIGQVRSRAWHWLLSDLERKGSDQYIVHLKLIECYVPLILQLKKIFLKKRKENHLFRWGTGSLTGTVNVIVI